MQVIRDNPGRQLLRSSVVTIGNFDGLHLGHQALIRHCESLAGDERPIAVVTFEPLPQAWFRPETAPARLMSVRQKLDFLACEAIDLVWIMRFNQALASMDAADFVKSVLVDTLAANDVVVGEDFRYGKGRQGDVESLRLAGEQLGFKLHAVPMLDVGGCRASSSIIRDCLAAGDLEKAGRLLGRPFSMTGRVIRGRQLGRRLGYPTANIRVTASPSPLLGVFAIRARWGNSYWHDGVANLGTRPAVGGEGVLLEAHIFDFTGSLYGQKMEVEFIKKLRDEANFEVIDDLVVQMREDERQARFCLAPNEN
ncbi:MAG TPA: bifunctional riboflavin kinase/FAD synthetase [Xanthomonadales bacterium]